MKQKAVRISLFLFVTLCLFAATLSPSQAKDMKNQMAPAWELKDIDGKTVKLSDFKGKVILLDFWATWCPPCREEIPGFINLQKKYGDKGVVIIGVSVDEGGPDVVKKFAQKLGVNYPMLMASPELPDQYGGIEGIPTTFIIDKTGKIVDIHVGMTPEAEFEKIIKGLL
ncbi:MAG: TlpA disulfide reductase family protein [Verrucomicrobiota bacterium]|nr:TlpA disulfide reductase family protein [Verrucomicrobiota bacterium]